MSEPEAVFHVDGDTIVPTELARGPWSPHAQHGGAPSALLAGMLERFEPGPAEFTARLTVDLMRPVPLSPLRLERTMVRPGKKVQIVQGSLFDGDTEVVRAVALRMRADRPALRERGRRRPGGAAAAAGQPVVVPVRGRPARTGSGTWSSSAPRSATSANPTGRTAIWFRLRVPVIAGEEPSPLQRVAAVADFGNGMGMAIDRERFSFINPDLTVILHREPVGEWVALDGSSYAERQRRRGGRERAARRAGPDRPRVQTIVVEEWPSGGRPEGQGIAG